VTAVLEDWRTAPIDDKLSAVFAFLEKLTTAPAEAGPADIERMRSAGVNDQAIIDAAYVCFIFSVVDRLADSFDFGVDSPEEVSNIANFLFEVGYSRSSISDIA